MLPISNAEHTIVDVDLGSVLIELPEAHDAVAELWDVEDVGQDLVCALLAGEDNGATTLDTTPLGGISFLPLLRMTP